MAPEQNAPIVLGRVLVVGGCGFLGYHVVDQLLGFPSEDTSSVSSKRKTPSKNSRSQVHPTELEYPSLRTRFPTYQKTQVHVLDLRCNRNRLPGAEYHDADICDVDSLLQVFRAVKPEVVINTVSPLFDAPHEILRKVNTEGTKNLVEVAAGLRGDWGGKCKAFAHTSSSSIVHDGRSDLIFADEEWPYVRPNPVEYYSETKADAEETVLQANDRSGMLTCAIRPAGIVGEKDRGGISAGFLSAAQNSPDWQLNIQLGEGDNLFDCTYVGNVAFGLTISAEALLATHSRLAKGSVGPLDHEKVDGEAFNVTNDTPIYFWDMARYVWTLYGRTSVSVDKIWALSESLMYPIGGLAELTSWVTGRKTKITRAAVKYSCIHRYYNCGKLKERCGYLPLVGLEEALGRSVRQFAIDEKAEKAAAGQGKKLQ